jgi:hypothetical protein
MLETSRIYACLFVGLRVAAGGIALALAACTAMGPEPAPPTPVASSPAPAPAKPAVDRRALAEEARALLAQAETDVQRARARRALWTRAWESLVAARTANAAGDSAVTIRSAQRASEFAQLGLEQLAYPPVKQWKESP